MSVKETYSQQEFFKKRNSGQEYSQVEILKSTVQKAMRDIHVASFASVVSSTDTEVKCIPFPIREGSTPIQVTAINLTGKTFKKDDIVFIVFTDRDYRTNLKNATSDENTISSTSDNVLHSQMFGVCLGAMPSCVKGDEQEK